MVPVGDLMLHATSAKYECINSVVREKGHEPGYIPHKVVVSASSFYPELNSRFRRFLMHDVSQITYRGGWDMLNIYV